jgi:hypothetical protein
MSLDYTLLGALEEPRSGYELKQWVRYRNGGECGCAVSQLFDLTPSPQVGLRTANVAR